MITKLAVTSMGLGIFVLTVAHFYAGYQIITGQAPYYGWGHGVGLLMIASGVMYFGVCALIELWTKPD